MKNKLPKLKEQKYPKKGYAHRDDIEVNPMGQYDRYGEYRIPSNSLTMNGVPYPVMAYPNNSAPFMMYPGQNYYVPGADYVDEVPALKEGGWLSKYDDGGPTPKKKYPWQDGLHQTNYSSDTEITNKIKADFERSQEVARRKAEAKRTFVGQARETTPQSEEIRKRLNRQYAATHPYASIDEQGNLSRKQWDRSMEGVADKYTRAADIDKGLGHAATAMEMAGYLEGAGALGSLAKKAARESMESGILSNVHKLNPWSYQRNLPKNKLWRGFGESGYKDAIETGVLRAPSNSSYEGKLYFTPRFSYADELYAKGFGKTKYIAEVPEDAGSFVNSLGEDIVKDPKLGYPLHMVSKGEIPVSKARILKQDWLRGYKPVEVPNPKFISSEPQITRGPIEWSDEPGFIKRMQTYFPGQDPKKLAKNYLNDVSKFGRGNLNLGEKYPEIIPFMEGQVEKKAGGVVNNWLDKYK